MSKITNFKDMKVQYPNRYTVTETSGTKVDKIIDFNPGTIFEQGTLERAEYFNEIQKNSIYEVKGTRVVEGQNEIYDIAIDGSDTFVFDNLKLLLSVNETNVKQGSVLRFNGNLFSLKNSVEVITGNYLNSNEKYFINLDFNKKTAEIVGVSYSENLNLLKGKMNIENTIEDLKSSSKYKLGDVVEVLGFRAKGDGSHHKRIARATDDGSGELGQNGIWWCVLSSEDICFSMFGAKLDGITNDRNSIQKALNFANANKVDIKLRKSGRILIVGNVWCKTSVDFNGSTIICNDSNKNSVFNFVPDEDFVLTPLNPTNMNGQIYQYDFLKDLPLNTIIHIKDTQPYCIRHDVSPTPFYREEVVLHQMLGRLSHPTIGDYTDFTQVEFYTRKMDEHRYVKNFTFEIDMTPNTSGIFKMMNKRDNFTFENIIIAPTLNSMVLDIAGAYKGELLDSQLCYNLTVRNIIGNNITGLTTTYEDNGRSGYALSGNSICKYTIDNVNLQGAWGATGNNGINTVTITNSSFNRFDVHMCCKDLTFRDCRFYDWGLMLGDSRGQVLVENCIYYTSSRHYAGVLFNNYGTYGAFNPGNFIFKNIKVYLTRPKRFLMYIATSAGDTQFRGTKSVGNIYMENIRVFNSSSDKNVWGSVIQVYNSTGARYTLQEIVIKDVQFLSCLQTFNVIDDVGNGLGYSNMKVIIEDTEMTTMLSEVDGWEKWYPDTKNTYIPNNFVPTTIRTTGPHVTNLDLTVNRSKLVLVHDKFANLKVYDSVIGMDLYTNSNLGVPYNSGFTNSTIKLMPTGSDVTTGDVILDLVKKRYVNCIFSPLKFTNTPVGIWSANNTEGSLMIGCSADDLALTLTGKPVDWIKSKNNYLNKNYGETMSLTLTISEPYLIDKMKEQGIYNDYIAYRDELHEYNKSLNQEEDTMLLPVIQEPKIPESIKKFAEEYNLI